MNTEKKYYVEATAKNPIFTKDKIIKIGEKMPTVMKESSLEKYREYMDITVCKELKEPTPKAEAEIKTKPAKKVVKKKAEIQPKEVTDELVSDKQN